MNKDNIVNLPKKKTRRPFPIKHAFCDGPCWGLQGGEYPVAELLLHRIYFSLLESGHSAESAREEINAKLDEIGGLAHDPYGHVSFEMTFDEG
ncbi:MAG: hypothetical protein DBO99_18755 [gamma proteobacterium symbiont of Ctena orbiculata]|nr:MAG: hypothetical protein DBO99_18755 [gamma proteobacterium symbiont of Ctena orbiculata]